MELVVEEEDLEETVVMVDMFNLMVVVLVEVVVEDMEVRVVIRMAEVEDLDKVRMVEMEGYMLVVEEEVILVKEVLLEVVEDMVMEEIAVNLVNLVAEEEVVQVEMAFVLYNIILKGLISMIHSHNLVIAPPPRMASQQ